METCAFVHFTVNTFTDKEWGDGDESPAVFNPTDFDADQIVGAIRAAGLKGVILTAKHHDGFCLWPSRYTDHSIAQSPYRGGHGDIVREMADACRRQGVGFGVYLSPWDRNRADYGKPGYLTYYRNQLRELLTQYGPLFEVWFDGANGGTGYYGGARERRTIDATTYYQWPKTYALVRALQPGAVIFNRTGDIRWVGNEKGFAPDPCWGAVAAGWQDGAETGPGVLGGAVWRPAESDVSIRPGWFYHASQDDRVRTVANLQEIYLATVGRGASLLLNVPPDRRGRVADRDAAVLRTWGELRRRTFARDLAAGATVTASNVRGRSARFAADAVVASPGVDRYWATDDGVQTADLTVDLPAPATFDLIQLREPLRLGQRIDGVVVEAWDHGAWRELARAPAVGHERLIRLAAPATLQRLRVHLTSPAGAVALERVGLYRLAPESYSR